jgi:hypothetical protein
MQQIMQQQNQEIMKQLEILEEEKQNGNENEQTINIPTNDFLTKEQEEEQKEKNEKKDDESLKHIREKQEPKQQNMETNAQQACENKRNFEIPLIIVHRGGPESCGYPENTIPRISVGLSMYPAIELDVCSCKDGLLLFHDNDPSSAAAFARRSGIESDHLWRISNRW